MKRRWFTKPSPTFPRSYRRVYDEALTTITAHADADWLTTEEQERALRRIVEVAERALAYEKVGWSS